tara:strand:+ start:719 stop:1150 length:432 start_codon:yes stop_codon:yes gene_type:complete
MEMKLIDNFAELLHQDELPKGFSYWFIYEEGDEKFVGEQPLEGSVGRRFYLKDRRWFIDTAYKLLRNWNKERKNQKQFQKELEEQITPFQYFFDLIDLHRNLEIFDEFPRVLEKIKFHKDRIPKDSTNEQISEILNLVDEEDD